MNEAARELDITITNLMSELWDDLYNKHTTELKNFEGKLRKAMASALRSHGDRVREECAKIAEKFEAKGLEIAETKSGGLKDYLETIAGAGNAIASAIRKGAGVA